MKTKTVIIYGIDEDLILTIECFTDIGFHPKTAFASAVQDYARTEDGRRNPKIQKGGFTIMDLMEEIPEEICREHGFVISGSADAGAAIEAGLNLFLLSPRMQRCQDCTALVSTDAAAWFCDEAGKPCQDVRHCREWDKDPAITETH